PNMKEIGEVTHLEVEVDGVYESTIGIDVEAIDPWVRQLGPRRWWLRRREPRVRHPPTGGTDVFLPNAAGKSGGRREAHEAQGGHNGLQLVVGHDGFEGSCVPQR
ncbi:hypothetical protein PanWU01x14_045640, partial [Parasponia andersonii]